MKTKSRQMSFEDSINELEKIIKDVESNNLTLDELVEAFEKGTSLSNYCIEKLNKSKIKIQKLSNKKNK